MYFVFNVSIKNWFTECSPACVNLSKRSLKEYSSISSIKMALYYLCVAFLFKTCFYSFCSPSYRSYQTFWLWPYLLTLSPLRDHICSHSFQWHCARCNCQMWIASSDLTLKLRAWFPMPAGYSSDTSYSTPQNRTEICLFSQFYVSANGMILLPMTR